MDLATSRRAAVLSWCTHTLPPYLIAIIPWWWVLDMEYHFANDAAPGNSALGYRTMFAQVVYGNVATRFLSLLPAFIKA